jgi:hypothetical protein
MPHYFFWGAVRYCQCSFHRDMRAGNLVNDRDIGGIRSLFRPGLDNASLLT